MNLGLTTSFIIGGLLLLSILMMNMSVTSSSIQLTIRQTNQQKLSTISDMVASDIQKMGYSRESKTDQILLVAEDDRIQFKSDINNNGNVEIVTWKFDTGSEVLNTENPNDYVLTRTVHDDDGGNLGTLIEKSPIRLGVTEFNIQYYDTYGALRSNNMSTPISDQSTRDNVKQLYIKINLESAEKTYQNTNDDGSYTLSVWEKRFSPPNLEETN